MSFESRHPNEEEPILRHERLLTEVDHLLDFRTGSMQFNDDALRDVHINLVTAVQEAAMPYAVTTTTQELVFNPETSRHTFMWLGRTAVENAMSGYKFHKHAAARSRVDVEVDEARHATENLLDSVARVFISPRMTRADASLEDAQAEHLGDDDAVRVSWLTQDEDDRTHRVMQSLLVRDIPLAAWVAMLKDPENIFKKTIHIADDQSALSVMKIHKELELPIEKLQKGPVSILEAVLPYIDEESIRANVALQIKNYYADQEDMKHKAEAVADRWLAFEASLAESLHQGFANYDVRRFIISMQDYWDNEDVEIINNHHIEDTEFSMTRQLAAVLEHAKQNVLWGRTAVTVVNEKVSSQINPEVLARIRMNEELIAIARMNNMEHRSLEAENDRLIAGQNIKVGAGCPGDNVGKFKRDVDGNGSKEQKNMDKEDWKWKQGVCQVKVCSTRPGRTEVGPCSVCRKCQAVFDTGGDPTKKPVTKKKVPIPVSVMVATEGGLRATNEQFARA